MHLPILLALADITHPYLLKSTKTDHVDNNGMVILKTIYDSDLII
mgnify:FL=1